MSEQNPNIPVLEIPDKELTLNELIQKLSYWWKYFMSKWYIILIAGLIGGALGLTYAFKQKPIYKAALSFVLEDDASGGGIGGLGMLAGQFGIDIGGGGGGAFVGDNLLELMKSRSLVEKSLLTTVNIKGEDKTLVEYYIDFNDIRKGWKGNPQLEGLRFLPKADRSQFTLQQDSVLGVLYNAIVSSNLVVDKKDAKSSIILVKTNSENELFSKLFTEVLVKEVSDFYVDTKTKKSTQSLAILQQKTDSVRNALNSALSRVASSIDATPNANFSRQILKVPSEQRKVDVMANQAMLTEMVKNLEMSKISLKRETPLIQVIDRPILPLEKEAFGRRKGIIIGGLLGGGLALAYLFSKKLLNNGFRL